MPPSRILSRSSTNGSTGNRLAGMKPPLRPLPADFNLYTLLTAKYNRKTDNCGCFSFQNYTFQVDSPHPPVKKNIVFLFTKKTVSKCITTKNNVRSKLRIAGLYYASPPGG
jgi:hypothetical protein